MDDKLTVRKLLKLSPDMLIRIKRAAHRMDLSANEWIRRAIEAGLKNGRSWK